jgi:hypothetical protein
LGKCELATWRAGGYRDESNKLPYDPFGYNLMKLCLSAGWRQNVHVLVHETRSLDNRDQRSTSETLLDRGDDTPEPTRTLNRRTYKSGVWRTKQSIVYF